MRKLLALFLLLASTGTALAQRSNDLWVEVRSEHFTVVSDTNEKQARKIAGQFERMRSLFHQLFPSSSYDKASPIIVMAFRDKKDFQTVEPASYLSKGQLNLAGFFQSAPDKNYVLLRLDAEGEHPYATVYHEYTHYMLAKAQVWMPLWMNEGLAQFYQNTDIAEKDVLLGQPSSNDILYLRQQKLLPLPVLLKIDHTSPYYHEEQKGSVFYAESWALTHYLMITDLEKNQHRVLDYAKYLVQGEDSVTAAQHAWGDLNQMQKGLDSYISQLSFSGLKMKSGFVADESSFTARPLPMPEANALRADVLVRVNRKEEAQALLESVMRDDPKSALARETMGYLKFREGDIPSARKWFGEAVQLDSGSYLAHYYFAVMSISSGERGNDAAIESSLKTAIKLNASYAPAYDSLAQFYASRQEKLDEAHLLNVQAVQLEPQNMYYRMNAASVLAQQQKFASAISVLEVAAKLAKNPAETANVQSRLEQFRQIQTMMASGGHVDVNSNQSSGTNSAQTVVILENGSKRTAQVEMNASEDTHYPAEATGPKRKVEGVLRSVKCSYPSVLTATVERPGKSLTLYSNNYYNIIFTLGNYDSNEDINPCKAIEGMKAKVEYSEVTDDKVAGQISAIELNK